VLFKIEFVGDSDTPDDDLERSNDNDVKGLWFSFCEELDNEDEDDNDDDEPDEGDATKDIDKSRGLSV
jgi:hypothetical protein